MIEFGHFTLAQVVLLLWGTYVGRITMSSRAETATRGHCCSPPEATRVSRTARNDGAGIYRFLVVSKA
jgi:hypothetical protein